MYLRKDGTAIYVSIDDIPEKNDKGEIIGMRTAMIDISELKKLEQALKETSLRDELTGLYNRRGFFTLAEQEIRRTQRNRRPFYVIFIDFDRLKNINDTKGHLAGDQALKKLGEILRNVFRKSDIIARIGGDEFVVLASEIAHDEEVNGLIDRLKEKIDERNRETDGLYQISVSTGITRYDGTRSISIDRLLSLADREMYREKKKKFKAYKGSKTIFDWS